MEAAFYRSIPATYLGISNSIYGNDMFQPGHMSDIE